MCSWTISPQHLESWIFNYIHVLKCWGNEYLRYNTTWNATSSVLRAMALCIFWKSRSMSCKQHVSVSPLYTLPPWTDWSRMLKSWRRTCKPADRWSRTCAARLARWAVLSAPYAPSWASCARRTSCCRTSEWLNYPAGQSNVRLVIFLV